MPLLAPSRCAGRRRCCAVRALPLLYVCCMCVCVCMLYMCVCCICVCCVAVLLCLCVCVCCVCVCACVCVLCAAVLCVKHAPRQARHGLQLQSYGESLLQL